MSKLILTLGLGLASLIGAASARGGQDRDCGLPVREYARVRSG